MKLQELTIQQKAGMLGVGIWYPNLKTAMIVDL